MCASLLHVLGGGAAHAEQSVQAATAVPHGHAQQDGAAFHPLHQAQLKQVCRLLRCPDGGATAPVRIHDRVVNWAAPVARRLQLDCSSALCMV